MRRSGIPLLPASPRCSNPDEEAEQQIYVTFANGRIYLVTAQAPREELNGEAVDRLRVLVEETAAEVPGVNVGLTGEPVLEHRRNGAIAKGHDGGVDRFADHLRVDIHLWLPGDRPAGESDDLPNRRPGLHAGLRYLTVGHLNILTITFVPILIGLAIDYGVHLISRYEEELRHGKTEQAALAKAMVYTGRAFSPARSPPPGRFWPWP